ncbi:MAG TPA: DUF4129 domain-containing protein [Chthonomonadaceae bacterium]|nr:DUF4129 domain-containing protein [Chthonomonadaceae bacterium]
MSRRWAFGAGRWELCSFPFSLFPFPLLLLLFLLVPGGRTAAQPPPPAQVKADLGRILSGAEFRPVTVTESPLDRAVRWMRDRWNAFKDWLGRILRQLFGSVSLAGGGEGLMWVFVGLFIVLAAWLLARLLRGAWERRERKPKKISRAYDLDEAGVETVTEPDEWMQQAQRYAAEGDYRRAFRAVFLAILAHLNRAGAIEYDRSRTNGDYLRMLRGKGLRALYDALRPLTVEFDIRWYGNRATAEEDYQRCRRAYEQVKQLSGTRAAKGEA